MCLSTIEPNLSLYVWSQCPHNRRKLQNLLIEILHKEGSVDLLPPHPPLPFQHVTRDMGVVIDDTIMLTNLRGLTWEDRRKHRPDQPVEAGDCMEGRLHFVEVCT